MLPPKLSHILRCLAFKKIIKKDHRPVKSLFENTIGNQFFDFYKILTKTLQKKFRIEILAFSFQICFWNQFSTSGSGQTKNTQIRVFA